MISNGDLLAPKEKVIITCENGYDKSDDTVNVFCKAGNIFDDGAGNDITVIGKILSCKRKFFLINGQLFN